MFQHKIIEITNPIFPGFYESILDPRYNHILDSMEYEDGKEYTMKEEYYQETASTINDLCMDLINQEFPGLLWKKESEELESPTYYNYTTDRSFFKVHIKGEDYQRFINTMFTVYRFELEELIKSTYTSRSGFSSHYNNKLEVWEEKAQKGTLDYNEYGTLFEALIYSYLTYEDVQEEIMESITDISLDNITPMEA